MTTKQNAKTELQKFKTLTENIIIWNRRIQKFWNSTHDLCPLVSTFHPPPHSQRLLEEAKKLTEFITGKLTDYTRVFNEKSKLKKDAQFDEFVNRLNCTSLEIDTTILELMQFHMDQTTQLIRTDQKDQVIRTDKTTRFNSSKSIVSSKFEVPRNWVSKKKLEVAGVGNNVDLDWDSFDRDLAAMTDAVEHLTSPGSSTSNEVKKLTLQVEDLQERNSELMRQTVILDRFRRDIEGLEDLRKELNQERIRRLEAEQKLRDAEEETKAAKFAYNVAKAVANKMAICSKEEEEANDSFELIDRRDSAYDAKTVDLQKATNAAIEVSRNVTSQDTYLSFQSDDTNPFLQTSHLDSEEDTNPFVETSHQGTNPFLVSDAEVATSDAANWNPFSTSSSNPFLT